MRFGILHEASARPGDTLSGLYEETLELIDAAESAGFDFFGCSSSTSGRRSTACRRSRAIATPEIFYAMGIARTERIKFRTAVATLAHHHRLVLASRIATLDIVSGGRMEFGTGRGNSALAADAFGIPVEEMYDRWQESLEIILAAWASEEEFSWHGKFFDIPSRHISIKPVQKPHPLTYYAAFFKPSVSPTCRRARVRPHDVDRRRHTRQDRRSDQHLQTGSTRRCHRWWPGQRSCQPHPARALCPYRCPSS